MTHTFTIVLEFAGGTYVSQYRGRSPHEAARRWAKAERRKLEDAGASLPADVCDRLSAQRPVPLAGATNVWCATASASRGGLALVTLVKTAER